MFADRARIFIRAGKGGDGHVSFRREKYVANGGPDGGDGGHGGNIVFKIDEGSNTLLAFRYKRKFVAENGGNGAGYQKDLSYTLTSTDRHAVFARQRVDEFRGDDIASTQSARQAKDATDLVVEPDRQYAQLIRRLTPLECERLQGFPDDWTNIPGASDSARYRALGNSVAIPCVEFIMKSLREVTELETEQSQGQGDHHAEE